MANNCLIEFDHNEYGTYFTGQQLTGKVIFTLNTTKSFKGIKLQINGYAQCQWRERYGRKKPVKERKHKKKHTFLGHEDYIASTTYLVGAEIGNSIPIEAGTHTYSFACPIPINCPSSYEGTYGHIRYTVKVTFTKQGSSSRTYTKGFTVLKLLDLNRESALLKSPACNESFANFCVFNDQPVNLRVDVKQTGYVPGQMILISCQVNNKSKQMVKNLLISFNLRATYTSHTPCMRTVGEKICLVQKYCGPVAQQSIKNFTEIIRVPATTPNCDYLSKIVRISYEICVKALMSHFMSSPKCIIPITIGNVPLIVQESATDALVIDNVPTTSAGAMLTAESSDRNLLSEDTGMTYDLPPPSYEEAVFMTRDIDDDDYNKAEGRASFTPRFPVYNADNIALANAMTQTPPPNPPVKRNKHKNLLTVVTTANTAAKESVEMDPVGIKNN